MMCLYTRHLWYQGEHYPVVDERHRRKLGALNLHLVAPPSSDVYFPPTSDVTKNINIAVPFA